MTPTEFKAAVEKIIGIPPNRPSGEPFWWMLDTPSARLGVEIDGSRILMNFYDTEALPGLGENPATGQWNINGRDFNDDPEAMLRELARRLAKAGYVPPMPDQEMPERTFSIRRDMLLCTLEQWKHVDDLDLDRVTVSAFMNQVGRCGFKTAFINEEEKDFVALLYPSFKMRTLDGDLSDAIYDQLVMGNAPGPAPEGAVTLVCLGDLYADSCSVCGKRAEWGIASQSGPHGCTEAIKAGRCFCDDHLPKVTREPSDKPTPPEPSGSDEIQIYQRTCVHHTDAERATIKCPVCLERKINEALRRAEAAESLLRDLADLNAMTEAAEHHARENGITMSMSFINNRWGCGFYRALKGAHGTPTELAHVYGEELCPTLCEAFLRTLNLWKP